MQPTEMSDFLERVAALLGVAPADCPDPTRDTAPDNPLDEGSLMAQPMAALMVSSRGFDAVFGEEGKLLVRLSEEAEAAGDTALAELLRRLETGIADASLRPPDPPRPQPRFSGFVYPVI